MHGDVDRGIDAGGDCMAAPGIDDVPDGLVGRAPQRVQGLVQLAQAARGQVEGLGGRIDRTAAFLGERGCIHVGAHHQWFQK